MTYVEKFVRAYAASLVERIAVTTDNQTGVALVSFAGRHVQIQMAELVVQEEALRAIARAVDELFGVTP